jgi:hypothetical protein
MPQAPESTLGRLRRPYSAGRRKHRLATAPAGA